MSLSLMIYMFIFIRTGKDRKERDKIRFFVLFIIATQGWMTEKKMALYLYCSSCFPHYCITKTNTTYQIMVPFVCTFSCSRWNNNVKCYFEIIWHHMVLHFHTYYHWYSLYFTMQQLRILVSIVNFVFHHAATQNPSIYCQFRISSCGNSESWSRHQIYDTSFFYIMKCVFYAYDKLL